MTQLLRLEMVLAGGVVRRSSDLQAAGVRPQAIANALKAGLISRTVHGAYHLAGAVPEPWLATVAGACARMPRAVVCLTTAAHFELLVATPPPRPWLALPLDAYRTRAEEIPYRTIRWSYDGAFDIGIVDDEICGVPFRRTGAARTVVDLIRYARHLRGTATGIEAARRMVAAGGRPEEILEIARVLRTPKGALQTLEVIVGALWGREL